MMPIHTMFDLALTFPTFAVAWVIFRPRRTESTLNELFCEIGSRPCVESSPSSGSPSGMPS